MPSRLQNRMQSYQHQLYDLYTDSLDNDFLSCDSNVEFIIARNNSQRRFDTDNLSNSISTPRWSHHSVVFRQNLLPLYYQTHWPSGRFHLSLIFRQNHRPLYCETRWLSNQFHHLPVSIRPTLYDADFLFRWCFIKNTDHFGAEHSGRVA